MDDSENILFIGEGNFSFAWAVCEQLGTGEHLVCTCFDSEKVLKEKYEDAIGNIEQLQFMEAQILYGVDCTKLESFASLKRRRFSKIIFNFPHVGKGIKDQDRNIRANQELIQGFFESAQLLLEEKGEIYVTLKSGEPYDSWNIKNIAKSCELRCTRSFFFEPSDYPGYQHRRTIGFSEGLSAADNSEISNSKTFIFQTA
ncbi:hypothetical protein EDD86DRAFT_231639 [Gorgonomyces haynaldii]|nr:hypothetical protein EDD86DRAFT_231639 [Gorgonomyces haynaldii]